MKLLTGETSKGEKKSKKKRGRKRKRVGHGGGDSPSSSDSDGSRRSSPDWEESESSSTELLAPLQKRSSKKPGAVLKMLVHHAKRPIICGRDREGPTGDWWDQDLHIFQPACPALPQPGEQGYEGDEPPSRLPRRAKVGSAGETWGTFLAIHTAVNEASWQSARCTPWRRPRELGHRCCWKRNAGEGALASKGRSGLMEEQRKKRRWQSQRKGKERRQRVSRQRRERTGGQTRKTSQMAKKGSQEEKKARNPRSREGRSPGVGLGPYWAWPQGLERFWADIRRCQDAEGGWLPLGLACCSCWAGG